MGITLATSISLLMQAWCEWRLPFCSKGARGQELPNQVGAGRQQTEWNFVVKNHIGESPDKALNQEVAAKIFALAEAAR